MSSKLTDYNLGGLKELLFYEKEYATTWNLTYILTVELIELNLQELMTKIQRDSWHLEC